MSAVFGDARQRRADLMCGLWYEASEHGAMVLGFVASSPYHVVGTALPFVTYSVMDAASPEIQS